LTPPGHEQPVRAHALIFLGAPGAGKGTQAREVSKALGVPQISTGDMLREAIRNQTARGLEAKKKMEAGELVPDEIVCAMVQERIAEPDSERGFILDGFPRTLRQAEFVGRLLQSQGRGSPQVFNIRVDEEVLVQRLTGRRTCSVCGEIYNLYFNPPERDEICDRDGGKLIQRPDDREEAIRQRLAAYATETRPLIDYYRRQGLLHDVEGSRDPEAIAKDLTRYLAEA
jgi:adenylate kinase